MVGIQSGMVMGRWLLSTSFEGITLHQTGSGKGVQQGLTGKIPNYFPVSHRVAEPQRGWWLAQMSLS